jgi:hypothetical protein
MILKRDFIADATASFWFWSKKMNSVVFRFLYFISLFILYMRIMHICILYYYAYIWELCIKFEPAAKVWIWPMDILN